MIENLYGHTIEEWAKEITYRIGDECFGVIPHPESKNLLETWLVENPEIVKAMIGTDFIEGDYFDTED